jgi:hypothetical protein
MKTLLAVAVGWLVVCPVSAQVDGYGNSAGIDVGVPSFLFERLDMIEVSEATISYKLDASDSNSIFGSVDLPGQPASGPSTIHRFAGIDNPDALHAGYWLDPAQSSNPMVTVGYAWRDVTVEGSVLSSPVDDARSLIRNGLSKISSKSARLSFNPVQNWALQISRGSVLGLDQLVPDGEVRRTLVSANYRQAFESGDLQTSFSWGRNAKKYRESTTGYLVESLFKYSGKHAMFGRLEQVGSDELLRDNESIQRQFFKMNKMTVGYFHEFAPSGPVKSDVGVMVSRYFVPSAMSPLYGEEPTSYMMFIRLKLQ